MIQVEHFSKVYPGGFEAVRDLSFSVAQGEIVGFLGPNGSGKTTTMRALVGAHPPTAGRVIVAGIDVAENPLEVKRRIGYLPEGNPLYLELRIPEYLHFRARLKGLSGKARHRRVAEVMAAAELTPMATKIIGHLSRGYRQRVGLADALLSDPQVLIMDEPTSGLDPAQVQVIRDLVRRMKGRTTVLFSTHILAEVEVVCDRAIIIHQGRLVADERIDAAPQMTLITDAPPEQFLPWLSGQGIAEVEQAALLQPAGCHRYRFRAEKDLREAIGVWCFEARRRVFDLSRNRLDLERIFLDKIGIRREAAEETPSGQARREE